MIKEVSGEYKFITSEIQKIGIKIKGMKQAGEKQRGIERKQKREWNDRIRQNTEKHIQQETYQLFDPINPTTCLMG